MKNTVKLPRNALKNECPKYSKYFAKTNCVNEFAIQAKLTPLSLSLSLSHLSYCRILRILRILRPFRPWMKTWNQQIAINLIDSLLQNPELHCYTGHYWFVMDTMKSGSQCVVVVVIFVCVPNTAELNFVELITLKCCRNISVVRHHTIIFTSQA